MSRAQSVSLAANAAYFGVPALIVSAFTANPGLTAYAVAGGLAIFVLTYRAGEPPALTFMCLIQWLQGSLKLFQADMLAVPLETLAQSHNLVDATALTITWPVVTAIGIRSTLLARMKPKTMNGLDSLTTRQLFGAYLIWTIVLRALTPIASGGLGQIFLALANLRWAVVFALFWTVLSRKQHFGLAAAVFVIELASGFLSYFSTFKIPIYVLAMALPAGSYRLRSRHLFGLAIVAAMALYLAVIWSAIKVEYRSAMSGGIEAQEVTIGYAEQVSELVRLLGTVNGETLDHGLTALVDRIAYVDYFALTLDFVPAVRDHERGLLWGNALSHVLAPRLFFPDKPNLESDTEISRRYTGAELTQNPSTSISLGTPAESYVDFAVPLMFVPALLMGILLGLVCRPFLAYGTHAALAMGFAVALVLPMASIELTPSKALGGLLAHSAIGFVLWSFVPRLLRTTRARAVVEPYPG